MKEDPTNLHEGGDPSLASEISKDQFDQYFESEGEITPEETLSEPETEPVETQTESKKEGGEETGSGSSEEKVPLAFFIKEKTQRKELAKKMERMEGTFQKLLAKMEQRNRPPEPRAPSYEEDPIGSLAHEQKALQAQVQQQQQYLADRSQQDQQRQAYDTLVNQYRSSAHEFQTKQADFPEAYKFLVNAKIAEYTTIGLSRQEAERRLHTEELNVAELALKEGSNPAEVIYKLAKTRGYAGQTTEGGQAQKAQHKLKTIEKGMQTNRSLSSKGGKTQVNITLEQLSEMDPDDPDFDTYWGQLIG